jgi:hypothetical protein
VIEGVAAELLKTLRAVDQIAVLCAGAKVETLQGWTSVALLPGHFLEGRLLGSKQSTLARALDVSLALLSAAPPGNRHLVIVTDGIGQNGKRVEIDTAFEKLIALDIAVHVLSLTALGIALPSPSITHPRENARVPEETTMSLPRTKRPENSFDLLKDVPNMKGGVELDIDRAVGLHRNIKPELKQSQNELATLAHDTGGNIWSPESFERIFLDARAMAREIDSQYVITYRPASAAISDGRDSVRKIDVVSRRVGLTVRVRRFYRVSLP